MSVNVLINKTISDVISKRPTIQRTVQVLNMYEQSSNLDRQANDCLGH